MFVYLYTYGKCEMLGQSLKNCIDDFYVAQKHRLTGYKASKLQNARSGS